MRVLALDTTSAAGSAALLQPDGALRLSAPADTRPFGERLPAWLLELLREAGVAVGDIDLFVVGAGPGSLTGMRVGIATMQGLAMATGRPLVAVSALEALSHVAVEQPRTGVTRIIAWSDARRGEVFAQLFARDDDARPEALSAPQVGPPAELASLFGPDLLDRSVAVVGDAAAGTEALWSAAGARSVATCPAAPLAGVMARIGAQRAAGGDPGRPHAVRPIYVRRPDAEVARERAARGGKASRAPR